MFKFNDFHHNYQLDAWVNCPFHPSEGLGENRNTPSAKVYLSEKNEFLEFCSLDREHMHCFTNRRNYTCYDYIRLVLEEDPYTYLLENRDVSKIKDLYKELLCSRI